MLASVLAPRTTAALISNLMMMMPFICVLHYVKTQTTCILDVLAHAARDSHARYDFMRFDFHHG